MTGYQSFEELADHEVEGQDYRIRIESRDPRVLIMAPHGGNIERTTSEIAEAIAGQNYSFYSFEGLKGEGNSVLHIESHLFDEPRALQSVQKAEVVITVHGQIDQRDGFVMVGGLDESLGSEIKWQLEAAGFKTRPPTGGLMGTDPMNICNRGKSKQGVQLEISRKIRDLFRTDKEQLRVFSDAVRRAIQQDLKGNKRVNMMIERATISDEEEILALQKLAYRSEAEIYNDFNIPPLLQTLESIEKDFENQFFLKAVFREKIIGSVRAYTKEKTCYVGRLIVHPDFQNQGIGTKLMNEIEKIFNHCKRFELFTGDKSERNLCLYQKLGYKIFRTANITDQTTIVYLEKKVDPSPFPSPQRGEG
jgi:phage replication-related protein YjqB (UPF0714/DUF867 family)/N-acetylglutamate synthase-like GNAT family acetyltransferase